MLKEKKAASASTGERYEGIDDKVKLSMLLADMQTAVAIKKETVLPSVDEAALRIQRMSRLFLARKAFRKNLYKLIIFRNIIENKVHKEKMAMLFGFEQLIINTEEM